MSWLSINYDDHWVPASAGVRLAPVLANLPSDVDVE
jgi:hypothetical protein